MTESIMQYSGKENTENIESEASFTTQEAEVADAAAEVEVARAARRAPPQPPIDAALKTAPATLRMEAVSKYLRRVDALLRDEYGDDIVIYGTSPRGMKWKRRKRGDESGSRAQLLEVKITGPFGTGGDGSAVSVVVSYLPDAGYRPTDEELAAIRAAWVSADNRNRLPTLAEVVAHAGGGANTYHIDKLATAPHMHTDDGAAVVVTAGTDLAMWKSKRKLIFRLTDNLVQVRDPASDTGYKWVIWGLYDIPDERGGRRQEWQPWDSGDDYPLYGIDRVRADRPYRVFIHEGAGPAQAMQGLVDAGSDHPWLEYMSTGTHVGWIGGAHAAGRTDWGELRRLGVLEVVIVADNDAPGEDAVKDIARAVNLPALRLSFAGAEHFPSGFDLEEPFPDALFAKNEDGARVYTGLNVESHLSSTTWLTDMVEVQVGTNRDGTPRIGTRAVLRPHAGDEWIRLHSLDRYISRQNPTLRVTAESLNRSAAALSDSDTTARLINRKQSAPVLQTDYDPNKPAGPMRVEGALHYNVFRSTLVRPHTGDYGPFIEFVTQLTPDEYDRLELMRWLATLASKPALKMHYGVLLISRTKGTGKSTFLKISSKMVGEHNTETINENAAVSDFNDWILNKRLVAIHEIYNGHKF